MRGYDASYDAFYTDGPTGQLISEWLFGVFNFQFSIFKKKKNDESKNWSNQKGKSTLLCFLTYLKIAPYY